MPGLGRGRWNRAARRLAAVFHRHVIGHAHNEPPPSQPLPWRAHYQRPHDHAFAQLLGAARRVTSGTRPMHLYVVHPSMELAPDPPPEPGYWSAAHMKTALGRTAAGGRYPALFLDR